MASSDERLLHDFYACNTAALEQLASRLDPILARIAILILGARGEAARQALGEWVIDERLNDVWTHVYLTKGSGAGRWPHQRLSALTWLIYLLCLEMDRNMGLRPPF